MRNVASARSGLLIRIWATILMASLRAKTQEIREIDEYLQLGTSRLVQKQEQFVKVTLS